MMQICINRNILECKFLLVVQAIQPVNVLIETYWNVNNSACLLRYVCARRINRNILECK